MQTTNIIFAGVGGQGIILASRVVAECALSAGYIVKENELHGMAQRGGSVISHVRFGEKVYSPLIAEGEADYLVAMEELEGLRDTVYLKPGGRLLLNQRKIMPAASLDYPQDIKRQLKKSGFKVDEINALEIATAIGSAKAENMVLLGALAKYLPFPNVAWERVIEKAVPEKTIEVNLVAFKKGRGG